ncbi:hypothetical protein Desor_2115 [Desulfosporosinus orientis DSM 765]|uniref:Uncharacterized protein n=1 Tax=Desulfosporosinus orientis (strain ATCC 19365 / DSM 765 / NCIMB 8382 / VKM B-1628 / Singapore I) TaxID=768706 RepID=G7W659_DESOD|nr:hypothetical protein [Desulfosporosinus orientis]AET67721.1 hypothetical protein Desor_2115 [Desulfosporosinus orientis DSM 765]
MDYSYNTKSRLESLKKRSKRCLCKYCGNKLSLKRIIFSNLEQARLEIFCEQCGRIEYGVEPEIYMSAKYFIEKFGFNAFPDMDNNELTTQRSIAKVCEIMTWENKNLGIINEEGFQVQIKMNKNIMGECVILTDEDIAGFTEKEAKDFDAEQIRAIDIVEIQNT